MAGRKKKKGKKKAHHATNAGAAVKASACNVEATRTALGRLLEDGNWKKAFLQAEALLRSPDYVPATDEQSCVRALEMFLRELIAGRRGKQVRIMAARIRAARPELAARLPLGLQVAIGAVDDLSARALDPAFVARLNREMLDPAELELAAHAPWQDEAQALLAAWQLLEERRYPDAREKLAAIGRRSPLADWRLLLQAMLAAGQGNLDILGNTLDRMTPGVPATLAAQSLYGTPARANTFAMPRSKALLDKTAIRKRIEEVAAWDAVQLEKQFDTVIALVDEIYESGRIELAGTLHLSCICSQDEAFYENCTEQLIDPGRTPDILQGIRLHLRELHVDYPPGDLIRPATLVAMLTPLVDIPLKWPRRDRAMLINLTARHFRTVLKMQSHSMFLRVLDQEEGIEFAEMERVIRMALRDWPDLTELYEHWHAIEQVTHSDRCQALEQWHKADRQNVDVLKRYAQGLIECEKYKQADALLAKLRAFPGEKRAWAHLRSKLLLRRCQDACVMNSLGEVRKIAADTQDIIPEAAAAVALMHRCLEHGQESIQHHLAHTMAELGDPWKTIFVAAAYLPDLVGNNDLPDTLRNALQGDPVQQARAFLGALDGIRDLIEMVDDMDLVMRELQKLLGRLEDPEMIFRIIHHLFFDLDQRAQEAYFEFEKGWKSFVGASVKLLRSGESWQVNGLWCMAASFLHGARLNVESPGKLAEMGQHTSVLVAAARSIMEGEEREEDTWIGKINAMDVYDLIQCLDPPAYAGRLLANALAGTKNYQALRRQLTEHYKAWTRRASKTTGQKKRRSRKQQKRKRPPGELL